MTKCSCGRVEVGGESGEREEGENGSEEENRRETEGGNKNRNRTGVKGVLETGEKSCLRDRITRTVKENDGTGEVERGTGSCSNEAMGK